MTTRVLPLVSIAMPIRNEAGFIARSLGAVLAENYPSDRVEIFLVDGQSEDGTPEIAREVIRQHSDRKICLLDNPKRIFSTGFNIALSQARGEIVIMLGGHTEIPPDYIRVCVEYLGRRSDVACVGGFVENIAKRHLGQTIALSMGTFFGVGGVAFRTLSSRLGQADTVAFGAYRRAMFQKYGLLDEEMVRNQDDEFNYRLREMGERILLVPDIQARYHSRSSLASLWQQYFQYGYWKVRVLQKHPRQMRLRQFVPPAFVAALMGSYLFAWLFPLGWVLFIGLSAAYILANVAASVWTAFQKGLRNVMLLPLVFSILHISYGTGFLVGLVKFRNRWGDKKGKVPEAERTNV